MWAFIIGGLVMGITLVVVAFIAMANGMSDAPSQSGVSIWPALIGGTVMAALIVASHWLPHIGW